MKIKRFVKCINGEYNPVFGESYESCCKVLGIYESILEYGICYYNCLGEVKILTNTCISSEYIIGKQYKKQCCFKIEEFGKTWWLTYTLAKLETQKYIDEIKKYVSLKTLKKVLKLKPYNKIFLKDNEEIIEQELGDYVYFDKHKKALIEIIEYDDDFGGYQKINEYYISDYGRTWTLTKEELVRKVRRND